MEEPLEPPNMSVIKHEEILSLLETKTIKEVAEFFFWKRVRCWGKVPPSTLIIKKLKEHMKHARN